MSLSVKERDELAKLKARVRELERPIKRERKAKLKAQNTKPTRGVEVDKGFLAYLRRQPCEARHLGNCEGRIEAAHIRYSDALYGRNPGMQRKNHDRNANPLCTFHHHCDQHMRHERDFWDDLGKNAYETAAVHYAAYRSAA